MKKLSTMCIGGLFVFVVVTSLMIAPFIGAYHAITHPIETTVDFVTMMIGSITDVFDNEITVDDMDVLVSLFYERTEHKELIDSIVLQYDEYQAVTPENLIRPFVFSQCNQIDEKILKEVANFISTSI